MFVREWINLTSFCIVGALPNLIDLNLKKNAIKDLKALANEEAFPYLQVLNWSLIKTNEIELELVWE